MQFEAKDAHWVKSNPIYEPFGLRKMSLRLATVKINIVTQRHINCSGLAWVIGARGQ